LRTTTVTVFETFAGAKENEFTAVSNLFAKLPLVPFTHEDAERGGIVLKKLRDTGNTIDPQDAMIAGIALGRNEPLVTRNRKHFEKIPRLRVVTY
jgi:predicted nucleic acid-binding protein